MPLSFLTISGRQIIDGARRAGPSGAAEKGPAGQPEKAAWPLLWGRAHWAKRAILAGATLPSEALNQPA